MADTHYGSLAGRKRTINQVLDSLPTEPQTGDFYVDTHNNRFVVYDTNQWYYANLTTTTSTSTSTTTTTSTSTSTSTSTTQSTTTSTTTSTSTTI